MTVSRELRKKKPERRPLFFTVRKALLIDTATGEIEREPIGVLAPRDHLQRRYMRERKYRVGDMLKADVRKDRGYQQLKTAHGLGLLCIEQIERFAEFTDAHECIKALQRESGICCETFEIDATPVVSAVLAAAEKVCGKVALFALRKILPAINTVPVTEARSISYDTMDAGAFNEFFVGLCNHVLRTYWSELDEEEGRAKIQKWIGENV